MLLPVQFDLRAQTGRDHAPGGGPERTRSAPTSPHTQAVGP
jgi:hypothetical protein